MLSEPEECDVVSFAPLRTVTNSHCFNPHIYSFIY